MALGAAYGGGQAFGLAGDRRLTEQAEAGIDLEYRRMRARGLGCGEATTADGTDAAGAQAVGKQGRQRIVASGTALDSTAVEALERGVALWAVGGWRTAIAEVFERGAAVGTVLRRGQLRDVVDESKRGLERSDFNERWGDRERYGFRAAVCRLGLGGGFDFWFLICNWAGSRELA